MKKLILLLTTSLFAASSICAQPLITNKSELEEVLSKAISMQTVTRLPVDERKPQAEMLATMNARFINKAFVNWGEEHQWEQWYEIIVTNNIKYIDDAYIDAGLEPPHIQAGIYEIITTNLNDITLPGWILDEFYPNEPPHTDRNFDYSATLYELDHRLNEFGTGRSVPDITKIETQMYFYYQATKYIDAGIDAIHWGQIRMMDDNDPGYIETNALLNRIRDYAAGIGKQILFDAHTHGSHVSQFKKFVAQFYLNHFEYSYFFQLPTDINDNKDTYAVFLPKEPPLLFDFHSYPTRADETINNNGILNCEINPDFGIYNRSWGGESPQFGIYIEAPYLVEFDNYGGVITSPPGQSNSAEYDIWGYDESTWFALQPSWYRCQFMNEAISTIHNFDSHGNIAAMGIRKSCPDGEGSSCYNFTVSDFPDEVECIPTMWHGICDFEIIGNEDICDSEIQEYTLSSSNVNDITWNVSGNLEIVGNNTNSSVSITPTTNDGIGTLQATIPFSDECQATTFEKEIKIGTPSTAGIEIEIDAYPCAPEIHLHILNHNPEYIYEWEVSIGFLQFEETGPSIIFDNWNTLYTTVNYKLTITNKCGSETINGTLTTPECDGVAYSISIEPKWSMDCHSISFISEDETIQNQKIIVWYNADKPFVSEEQFSVNTPFKIVSFEEMNKSLFALTIDGLKEDTDYYFAYQIFDETLNELRLDVLERPFRTGKCSHFPFEESGMIANADCEAVGIKWNWNQDTRGHFEVIETEEATPNPSKDAIGKTIISIQDSQKSYYYFTKNEKAKWLYLRYVSDTEVALKWLGWNLEKSQCGLEHRSSNGNYLNPLDFLPEGGARLYPNPTKDELHLTLEQGRYEKYSIVDAMGNTWKTNEIITDNEEIKLDVSTLPPGIYFMQLQGSEVKWKSIRFIVISESR